jgi:transcriptional regulator with XRE-family HTH domain
MTEATIGDALLAKRKQRRLDQGRAAAEIGVSPSTYRSYEKNTQRPSVNVFPLLSKFLGLEIEEFLPLYGATVIFALRPALERELALQNGHLVSESRPDDTTVTSENRWPESKADDGDDASVEDEEEVILEGSTRDGLSYVEVVAAMEVENSGHDTVEISEADVDEEEAEDDDEDDDDDPDDDDLDQEDLARFDDESGMNMHEAPVASTVSQATSWPSGDLKSTKAKKKKKKNKKR